ncbi:hypothetical protein Tco_0688105 [Tanacetum coccineum]
MGYYEVMGKSCVRINRYAPRSYEKDGEGRNGGEAKVGFAVVVVLTMVWWGGCSDGGGDVDVRRLLAEGGGRRMAVVGEGDGGVEMEMKVSWR